MASVARETTPYPVEQAWLIKAPKGKQPRLFILRFFSSGYWVLRGQFVELCKFLLRRIVCCTRGAVDETGIMLGMDM